MSQLPLRTAISDTYPLPSNATARIGFGVFWDAVNEATQAAEIDLASAATCDIGGQVSTKLRITGTTTITSFGTNYRGPILFRMAGIVTLTHNATTLRCPGSTNITTAAGDVLMAWPTATVSGTLDGWQVTILSRGTGGETFPGAVAASSTLAVTGAATFASTLDVTGVATFTAPPVGPTQAATDDSTKLATTAHVLNRLQAAPAFRAAQSVSQALTTATATKITLGSEEFDTNTNFSSSRFTPTVAGYYQFHWGVGVTGTSMTDGFAMLYFNGAEVDRGSQLTVSSGAAVTLSKSSGSCVIPMNGSTDYVEVYAQFSGSSLSATYSRFSGCLVRPL